MSGLFGRPRLPAPPKPKPLPDEASQAAAARRKRQQLQAQSGARGTQLASRPAQQGSEFTRQTLG